MFENIKLYQTAGKKPLDFKKQENINIIIILLLLTPPPPHALVIIGWSISWLATVLLSATTTKFKKRL